MIIFLTCLAGITVFAYYATKGCDPLTSKQIKNANQVNLLFYYPVILLFFYSIILLFFYSIILLFYHSFIIIFYHFSTSSLVLNKQMNNNKS